MEILQNIYDMTAFAQTGGDWSFLIMLAIACVLLYLGIVKKYEPLLLVPIGMGVLLANFPVAVWAWLRLTLKATSCLQMVRGR